MSTQPLEEDTEKRTAIPAASLLSRLIRQEQDELAQSQRRIEAMLQNWQDGVLWSVELK